MEGEPKLGWRRTFPIAPNFALRDASSSVRLNILISCYLDFKQEREAFEIHLQLVLSIACL